MRIYQNIAYLPAYNLFFALSFVDFITLTSAEDVRDCRSKILAKDLYRGISDASPAALGTATTHGGVEHIRGSKHTGYASP